MKGTDCSWRTRRPRSVALADRGRTVFIRAAAEKSMRRICSLVAAMSMAIIVSGGVTVGATQCSAGFCTAYIPREMLPRPIPQQTPVWCWAASIALVFEYYGHPVDQSTIVSRFYGSPAVVTGNPFTMGTAFNTGWLDQNGAPFRSHARITDLYMGTSHQVGNRDVVAALDANKPVFFGNATHAMVLVAANYLSGPGGPEIVSGWVIDPYPGPGFGLRFSAGPELQASFVAIPDVQ